VSNYQAVLICQCGNKDKLTDAEYEEILRNDDMIRPSCGHWKYGCKIRARHKVDTSEWRMVYGSTMKGDSREA
jgi:hypothetical protein